MATPKQRKKVAKAVAKRTRKRKRNAAAKPARKRTAAKRPAAKKQVRKRTTKKPVAKRIRKRKRNAAAKPARKRTAAKRPAAKKQVRKRMTKKPVAKRTRKRNATTRFGPMAGMPGKRRAKKKPTAKPARKRGAAKPRKRNRGSVLVEALFPVGAMHELGRAAGTDLGVKVKRAKARNSAWCGRGTRKNPLRPRHRRRNGERAAESLYEKFHGRPSEQTMVVSEETHGHAWLAGMGGLVSLDITTIQGDAATLEFDENNAPLLCSTPDGRQLHIMSGDQKVDLAGLNMGGGAWVRDSMVLGVVDEITYQTEKAFHAFEPIDYYHAAGEETGVKPFLLYDPVNAKLQIAGGQYEVRWEGIVN